MRIMALFSFVLVCSLLASAANCDCTIFPWKKECDKQCGIARGKVKAVEDDKLILDVQKPNGGTKEETFIWNDQSSSSPSSVNKADVTKDSHVTITCQKENNGTKVVKSAGATTSGATAHD